MKRRKREDYGNGDVGGCLDDGCRRLLQHVQGQVPVQELPAGGGAVDLSRMRNACGPVRLQEVVACAGRVGTQTSQRKKEVCS